MGKFKFFRQNHSNTSCKGYLHIFTVLCLGKQLDAPTYTHALAHMCSENTPMGEVGYCFSQQQHHSPLALCPDQQRSTLI